MQRAKWWAAWKHFLDGSWLQESLVALRRSVMSRTGGVREKLRSLVDDLPDDTALLPPHTWPGEEKDMAAASEKAAKLETQVSFLERLKRHFDNPWGPDLLTVLTTLWDEGRGWLHVPDAGPDFRPPSSVIGWLREVVSYDLAELADQLEIWESRITARRIELLQRVFDLRKIIQGRRALLEKSKQIYDLLRDSGLNHQFGALIDAGSPIFSSTLKTMLGSAGVPNNLLTAIERVQKIVSQRRQIEELDERREVVLQRRASYQKAKELIDSVTEALEREAGRNSVLNTAILPSDDVIRDLQRVVNQVLDRFRLVDGIWSIRFEVKRDRSGKAGSLLQIYGADGRPLSAFSTGQKAQLGLAMLLGLNYSLNKYIGHNIIALDDVTTAFDVAQLPRTAALIRQIAYATGDASARRQVFIVSHHEDLTNRLLDFLIPPQGRKLRILNYFKLRQLEFKQWASD